MCLSTSILSVTFAFHFMLLRALNIIFMSSASPVSSFCMPRFTKVG